MHLLILYRLTQQEKSKSKETLLDKGRGNENFLFLLKESKEERGKAISIRS